MNPKKDALGRKPQGTGDTSAAASVSFKIIPPLPDNPIANEINEMCELTACLSDRLLVAWALLLRDMTPESSPRGYLFQQLLRCEVRRRRRNGGAS